MTNCVRRAITDFFKPIENSQEKSSLGNESPKIKKRLAEENHVIRPCKVFCIEKIESLQEKCIKMNIKMNPVPYYENDNSSSESEYEVFAIRKYRKVQNKCQYFVNWKDYPESANTWESLENLSNCRDMILNYHSEHKMKLPDFKEAFRSNIKEKLLKMISEIIKNEDVASLLKLRGLKPQDITITHKGLLLIAQELRKMLQEPVKQKTNHFTPIQQIFNSNNGLKHEFVQFAEIRKDVLQKLKIWERDINLLPGLQCQIKVENNVDLEGPPEKFIYITDYKAGEGVLIPDDPPVGCDCENCYENRKKCCGSESGGHFAYNKFSSVIVPFGSPIYECNKRCNCGSDCPNRVVQHGRQVKVCIFRSCDGRGWGVKTLQKVRKGSFVMEYIGEVITNEEAEKRGLIYDAGGRTYLFDLDYDDQDCPYTVDAAHYGNVAHFMNHSCEPNLGVYCVWINNLDPKIPRIAFFAKQNIKSGEELTFDYGKPRNTESPFSFRNSRMSPYNNPKQIPELSNDKTTENDIKWEQPTNVSDDNNKPTGLPIECKCQSSSCRGFLF